MFKTDDKMLNETEAIAFMQNNPFTPVYDVEGNRVWYGQGIKLHPSPPSNMLFHMYIEDCNVAGFEEDVLMFIKHLKVVPKIVDTEDQEYQILCPAVIIPFRG